LVVIDEFLTVSLYQPNEFISRKIDTTQSHGTVQLPHQTNVEAGTGVTVP